jgi:hypothetical protein
MIFKTEMTVSISRHWRKTPADAAARVALNVENTKIFLVPFTPNSALLTEETILRDLGIKLTMIRKINNYNNYTVASVC